MESENKIELESGTLEIHPDGYLKGVMGKYSDITLEEAKKREEAFLKLCNGKPYPFLFETRSSLINYSEEAREYFANSSKMMEIRLAEAFIVDNSGVRLFIMDYLKKNPTKCPTKIFTNEEDAIIWLKEFI